MTPFPRTCPGDEGKESIHPILIPPIDQTLRIGVYFATLQHLNSAL